mmetsp:Transcript_3941/g.8692  ORF Transcript_3941/g.8692 Transcript_3941/m.8692 type:complete len:362 (+) Transcript_3941:107-1192(+)
MKAQSAAAAEEDEANNPLPESDFAEEELTSKKKGTNEAEPKEGPKEELKAPCRQYIIDRCDGVSKKEEGKGRPPLKPCLPPPCIKWCPTLLEQNAVCKTAGSLGVINPKNDRWRARIFKVGIVSNVIGLILTIVACASISLQFDALMSLPFSYGSSISDNPRIPGINIGIGLRGVAVESPLQGQTVWTFDQFCDRAYKTGTVQYFGEGVCRGCGQASSGLVSTLLISVVTYFPNIFTDVTRMYSNYDVNCQKMVGSFFGLLSLFLSLYTWQEYIHSCFSAFYEGVIPYNTQGYAMSPKEVDTAEKRLKILVNMEYDWKAGNGLILVVTATALKIIDIVCNLLVPTPTITRNKDEQIEYENL